MRIAFNPEKDAINRATHGVSLAFAHRIDWLMGLVRLAKTVRGEHRWQWVGVVDGIVYSAIFTHRDGGLWIISRASRKERREYEG